MGDNPHILIVGGGYVGMYTAYRLQRKLSRGEATVTVVEPQNNMTYQPFLPEAAAGSIEPRHVVVPLRRVLRGCKVITGMVLGVDHARRVARVAVTGCEPFDLAYDILVMAPGSVARTLPIPGLAEFGIGFKNLGEAIYLRNHVLSRLDFASSTRDPDRRRAALTFVFVGGGYAGIEAFAELEDMARYAVRYYDELSGKEMRWVLVEAAERILPEVSIGMAAYTVRRLLDRGMDIRLGTRMESMVDGHVVLSDGERFDADTVVWTAGVKANPLVGHTDLPKDSRDRLVCDAELRVRGVDGAWGAGDCAAVPDLTSDQPGATCGPSAQHAMRQARRLADNLVAVLRGGTPRPYRHAYAGSVATLGLHRGVAEVYGVKLRGFPAWVIHRTYHVSRMPTFNRKTRVVADWSLALFFRREVVSLGQIQQPRAGFEAAARSSLSRAPRT
ncbi:MAG TPA: NAD(P)/FAD-dependent oxidoreductase [Mycobacteriales bacterium]|nr:NAD(P)/FAD-dependent oxidoreductase [Mycobacteriales bacterium]